MIPYGSHDIQQSDIDAVIDVLKNEFLTQGSQVPAFEQALCDYTGAHFAVAANSGTSALHIACLAAGVGPGDWVWTSVNSFAASANCALYCGALIDFVDIDAQTRNMSISALKEKLAKAEDTGTLPKAVVVVHFAGSSCDMKAISAITEPYGIALIEDAAHALGGEDHQGNKVGRCTYSDMTILSFHPVKAITSAEGGAVTTNCEGLKQKLKLFASHGITRDSKVLNTVDLAKGWFYAQIELGYNYRLSDLHAVLGKSQLERLDTYVSARFEKAQYYHQRLSSLPVKLPMLDVKSAWHLYVVELTEHNRQTVFNVLRENGVGVNVHYIPIHLHPYYQKLGFKKGQFPIAERYYNNALSLPLYPTLCQSDQDYVIAQLEKELT
ncbi:UDP-4-amino-4,6-dideoxy-N-acetyl-beta-L-altrosamine transaminase [Alteromonas sp. ASW11-130]|uniref:UDP-4-amino-4, 6-dideoxy-N-acetyl-beta-L-altrosamine transaminase n=1 Tax=Alteromonas sp. ASW11-130 TaxID=3015775 RepID=UPI0022428FDD|nr:UDP-4-amino-4,6-dideoxy-N-acetyl-beta-L-altrosamine transaminase [Alteromonas sp. ASW11-130]MCW8090330.1 UDP-4-amino-4,6-dideoxy-N-acetyl-beta-L-altrosamine transaminase [Alteromonas sp. ASW11-130]